MCKCFETLLTDFAAKEGVEYECTSQGVGMNRNVEPPTMTVYPFTVRFQAEDPSERRKHKAKNVLPGFCCFCGERLELSSA